MKVYCKFLQNGYCSKGNHCEFSHDENIKKIPCKFFINTKQCKFGSNCTFSHALPIIPKPISTNNQQSSVLNEENQISNTSVCVDSLNQNNSLESKDMTINTMWGHSDTSTDDGVYFYGAAGVNSFKETESNKPSYANILTTNIHDNHHDLSTTTERTSIKREVCPFYLSGNCKFGDYCRNLHDLSIDKIDDLPDCGICIGPPENGTYGLLSHCECVFCIDCIRNWRKEGIDVTYDQQQVRKCPLW